MDYDEMLERALNETPDIAGDGERFEVADPELRKEGNVTVFENFQRVTDDLGREGEHVMGFLQNELGTSSHIDENGRARFTGSFRPDRIAAALDDYADAYVICPECGLPDTRLVTEQEMPMRRCEACGARTPVDD